MRSHSSIDLPDRAVVEEYVSAYRASIIRAVFPFIDLVLFKETLRTAYEPPGTIPPYGILSAKATVLAFLSFVQIFNLDTQTPLQMDAEACAAQSQSVAPQLLPELTLDCLQTNIMLVSQVLTFGPSFIRLANDSVCLSPVLWRSSIGSPSHVLLQPSCLYARRSYQSGAKGYADAKDRHNEL